MQVAGVQLFIEAAAKCMSFSYLRVIYACWPNVISRSRSGHNTRFQRGHFWFFVASRFWASRDAPDTWTGASLIG